MTRQRAERQGRSDVELVEAARHGDHAAFDTLVRKHTKRMYRVALRIVGDQAEAEDVVQDAWIAAWRGLSGFRADSAPATWLYRVVSNSALAHLRRRKPTVPLDSVLTDHAPALGTGERDDPEFRALRDERVQALWRAIATLEPSQRVPLVLRELEGLSYEEVAQILDVGVGSLHSRLRRARVALLAKLKEL